MMRRYVGAAVSGATVALLGDLSVRRELGKVGTQSDIHLHDFKAGGRDITTIVPDRYPDQVKGLSFAVLGADAAVLAVSSVDHRLGEQVLAADAARLRHGAIVLCGGIQPEQVQPLLAGTCLSAWAVHTDEQWPAVREHLGAAPPRQGAAGDAAGDAAAGADFVAVPVDHHFDVKGVGAVVLGVVRQGILRKGDTLMAWPDRVICPVRSIQVHDVDVAEAHAGDRVGLALRNTRADQLDRGMVLAPADAPVAAHEAGDELSLELRRSPFCKQALAAGGVVQVGFGMQFVPLRLVYDVPGAGETGTVRGVLEKGLVTLPDESGLLWHVDHPKQRLVGAVALA